MKRCQRSINIDTDNPAAHQTRAEADLHQVAQRVLWHEIPTLTAREIAQRKCVSKAWAAWAAENVVPIAKARRKNDARDWYFPIVFWKTPTRAPTRAPTTIIYTPSTTPSSAWSWSGMHHVSGDLIHPRPRSLPPLAYLPPNWTRSGHPCVNIVASGGGLLLITLHRERVVRRFNHRPQRRHHAESNWTPLLVCNPLTREWRELPTPDSEVSSWDYHGVQAHMVPDMVVHDEAESSYRVILTFRTLVCVYKSASDTWACLHFPRPRTWGYGNDVAWGYVCASAYFRGRLYFADVHEVIPGLNLRGPFFGAAHALNVFEIDEEAGEWKLHKQYDLRQVWDFQPSLVSLFRRHGFQIGHRSPIHRCFELVECAGEMYAVIPARRDEFLHLGRIGGLISGALVEMLAAFKAIRRDHRFMPLQFCIVRLQGDGSAHGVLRIQIPLNASYSRYRSQSLMEKILRNQEVSFRNWFKCTAKGSVIWVSCEDYLLQYDVVSGESKTQIIPDRSVVDAAGFPYRPSFHMKP